MNNTKDLIAKAKTCYDNNNFFDAKSYLLKALEDVQLDNKLNLRLYYLIADISYKINNFKDTEKYLLKYLESDRTNTKIFNFLGNVYLKKRDYKNSEKFYIQSINLDSKNETALVNLAILYQNLGNQKMAVTYYKKILKVNPKNIGVLYNLSNMDKSIIDEKNVLMLKKIVEEKKLTNFNMASSYFILAENEKIKKNFNKEIKLLKKANYYSFKEKDNINKQSNEYWFKIISNKFDKINYIKNEKYSNETKNTFPIFIIGLPRCGSTLIESIISSGKNKVENLGETNLVNWAFLNTNRNILRMSDDINKKEKIEIHFEKTTSKLINALENLNIKNEEKKIFFSEKSLENFYYIDLILNIYPNAKFINPYRNLIDNIFAVYKQFLSNISWSHTIEDILLYIDNYLSTMNFFKQKYPDKILPILLEDFTNNPKKISLQIYKFCNLEWDEKCLEFYKRNDLFSNTASNNQIRSSVQKYDQNKYQVYKQMLKGYQKKYNWLK